MTNLIATSVVRGSNQGESHGGVFLINTRDGKLLQPVDWNTINIDWRGRGLDRGLRGIEFHGENIYIAASDELFVFDQSFNIVGSFRNHYLKHCHEICIHGDHLFLTSTGFDSILGFNLKSESFDWGLKVVTDGLTFDIKRFDPSSTDGPLQMNKLHLNTVFCNNSGMYISGAKTKALLKFAGKSIGVMARLPEGIHNAQPFMDGVLFNDTRSDAVRLEKPNSRQAFRVPRFAPHKLTHTDLDDSRIARPGFGRGLCVISDTLVAAGSSPSTVSLYDLKQDKPVKAINISMDVRNAIHSLKVWPYVWPGRYT